MAARPHKTGDVAPADPEADELVGQLGPTAGLWRELVAHIRATYPPVTCEVKHSTQAGGGFLRLKRRQRTILYLLPRDGFFLTAFVFGGKATEAVRASDVPAAVIAELNAARVYAEGRGIRLPTRTRADLATMRTLASIKMSH